MEKNSLRRQEFSRSIRQESIESYKKNIRKDQFNYSSVEEVRKKQKEFNLLVLIGYFKQAERTNFDDLNAANRMVDYLLESFEQIAEDKEATKYLITLTEKILPHKKCKDPCLILQFTSKINKFIQLTLKNHLTLQDKEKSLNGQINSALLITLPDLLSIMAQFDDQFYANWKWISRITDPCIIRIALPIFFQCFDPCSLTRKNKHQLEIMVETIAGLEQVNIAHQTLTPYDDSSLLALISQCLGLTNQISANQIKYICDAVDDIIMLGAMDLNGHTHQKRVNIFKVNQKVQSISQKFDLFSRLFNFLPSYSYLTNPYQSQGQQKCGQMQQKQAYNALYSLLILVSRVFSADEKITQHIYRKNQTIIELLRQFLPFPKLRSQLKLNKFGPQSLSQNSGNSQKHDLTSNQQQILALVIFALSNIVSSGVKTVQLFILGDIYLCLTSLLPRVKPMVQKQIGWTLLNMIKVAEEPELAILIESQIIDALLILITNNENVNLQKLGVSSLKLIVQKSHRALGYDEPEPERSILRNKKQNCFMHEVSLQILKFQLQKHQLLSYLECLITSEDQQLSKNVQVILNLI